MAKGAKVCKVVCHTRLNIAVQLIPGSEFHLQFHLPVAYSEQ